METLSRWISRQPAAYEVHYGCGLYTGFRRHGYHGGLWTGHLGRLDRQGQATAATMAELARGRLRSKMPVLEQDLTGVVREHHRRLLALQLAHVDFLDEQIAHAVRTFGRP